MTCRLCLERGRPESFLSEPQCGFDAQGVFTSENWMCATLLRLRALAEDGCVEFDIFADNPTTPYGARWRAGDSSLGVVETTLPQHNEPAWIVLSWYKDRGQTGAAWFFYTTEVPRPLTIEDAERAIAAAAGDATSHRAERRLDSKRLDWLEDQKTGYGNGWIARMSAQARGYRLHETSHPDAKTTARAAIDAAMAQKGND